MGTMIMNRSESFLTLIFGMDVLRWNRCFQSCRGSLSRNCKLWNTAGLDEWSS